MISITQENWLTIKSTSGLAFEQMLRNVSGFADFVSLGVGESLVAREMSGSCDARDPSGATVSAQNGIDL
jgi:hypothetical protein